MRSNRSNRESGRRALAALGRLRLRRFGTARAPRFYSLRFSIATLFSALIAVLGGALILHGFERHRSLALDAAETLFAEVARNVAGRAGELYAPVEALVGQTARLSVGTGASVDELPLSIGYFSDALDTHPQLDAMYLGFDTGDFFLVRRAATDPDALAPESVEAGGTRAAYVVQRIERDRFEQPRYVTTRHDAALATLDVERDLVTGFDPRSRPWYRAANEAEGTVATDFYRFFTSGEIGTTLARRAQDGGAVVGADLTLRAISATLDSPSLPEGAEVVLFTGDGSIVGYGDAGWLERRTRRTVRGRLRSPQVDDIGNPAVRALFERFSEGEREGRMTLETADGPWFGSVVPIDFGAHRAGEVYVGILVPERALLAGQRAVRRQSALLSLAALALAIALAWWLASSVARSTRELTIEALGIGRLELDEPIRVRSRVAEIDRLSRVMNRMKSAVRRFVTLTRTTSSAESDLGTLSTLVLEQIRASSDASVATLLLLADDGTRLVRVAELDRDGPVAEDDPASDYRRDVVPIPDAPQRVRRLRPDQHAVTRRESVRIDDLEAPRDHDVAGYRSRSILVVPLRTERGGVLGVVHLGRAAGAPTAPVAGFSPDDVVLVEALASHAAMAFENQRLTEARRESFEVLIRMLARAIDAKSPHTGKHCQRVPILCSLLAEAASESSRAPFEDYVLDETARQELDVASWLHDCGKVTTPEHILDKATRLETVHNRIHEIRARFEILHRDAEIECLETLLADADADPVATWRHRDERQARLQEEFAYVATSNAGSTPMGPEQVRRVHEIASRTWLRHFDDALGLSPAELARLPADRQTALPVPEPLLADRPEHRVERDDDGRPWGDNPFGFTRTVPPHELDAGEIHNLVVARGTLTEEERFRVEDHVVKTIEMLDAIPFPKSLARVPAIAGNHHERLDGTGYPRGLTAGQLGIEDRILAIADVFEALTASDRPYRQALTLEGSIAIMRGMCDRGELCGDLFELFIERKLHLVYADRLHERTGEPGVRVYRDESDPRRELP